MKNSMLRTIRLEPAEDHQRFYRIHVGDTYMAGTVTRTPQQPHAAYPSIAPSY